jgi:hypothetical protein
MSDFLRAVKEPVARRAFAYLADNAPEWLPRLTVREGPRIRRRFWQPGGGYDRNITSMEAPRAMPGEGLTDYNGKPVRSVDLAVLLARLGGSPMLASIPRVLAFAPLLCLIAGHAAPPATGQPQQDTVLRGHREPVSCVCLTVQRGFPDSR